MRTIKCRNCGKIFEATGEISLCPDCKKKLKAESTLRNRVCKECGVTFLGGPRAWYCPECRAQRAKKSSRESKERKRRGNTRKIGSTDICVICGKEYIVQGGNQKYCPKCAPSAIREIDRKQGREWMKEHREETIKYKKQIAQNRRVCNVCHKIFYSDKPTVTCSPECKKILKAYNQAMSDHKRRCSPIPTIEEVKMRLSRKSGIPGVFRSRNGKRWIAKYKNKHIGTYDSMEEARKAIETLKKHGAK